jgi:hypothetical protein
VSPDLLTRVAGPAWEAAWSAALGAMELDVERAEALIRGSRSVAVGATSDVGTPPVWRPPTGLGLLPASLVARAQALLDRQLDVARRTAEAANFSRRQALAAEGMRSRPPAVPVYIDTEG